jgi:hypothetical protein
LDLRWGKLEEAGEKPHSQVFHNFSSHQNNKLKDEKERGSCNTHWGTRKCIQLLVNEKKGKRKLENLYVNGS